MSNNPGKKGKPAPWVKKADEHQRSSLEQFIRDNHAEYNAHCVARSEAASQFRDRAKAKYPGFGEISAALKEGDRLLRAWDKNNRSPLTWEERVELEKRFMEQYVRPDFS